MLGIEYPIVLAGMGVWGQGTPPALVAAVSEAGGLGVLGCSGLSPEETRARIHAVREMTDKPFGVDLLLPASLAPASDTRSGVRAEIERDYPRHAEFNRKLIRDFGLTESPVEDEIVISTEFLKKQIALIVEEKVPVFALGLGNPELVVGEARKVGMKVIGLAGSVRNAVRQKRAGVDIIAAQGTEAGGHTGRVATMPLVPQTVDQVAPTPVLAAGGIGDGRGIAAALSLGAEGAWIGTAFLVADECGIPGELKDAIIAASSPDFVVTRCWTGKTVRSVANSVYEAWEMSDLTPLPTPHQRVLMEDFLSAAKRAGRWDLYINAAGQIGGVLTQRKPAAEIMADLVAGTVAALNGLPGRVRTAA